MLNRFDAGNYVACAVRQSHPSGIQVGLNEFRVVRKSVVANRVGANVAIASTLDPRTQAPGAAAYIEQDGGMNSSLDQQPEHRAMNGGRATSCAQKSPFLNAEFSH